MHEAVFGPKEEDLDGDALAVKKSLWSCISCDKDLDKYQGKLGDYKGWAQFPPKNTNPDKMGKVNSNSLSKNKNHHKYTSLALVITEC